MKKLIDETVQETAEVHGFYIERFENMVGRILTLVELLGLSPTQEKALKDSIKREVYYAWDHAPFAEEKVLELGKTEPY